MISFMKFMKCLPRNLPYVIKRYNARVNLFQLFFVKLHVTVLTENDQRF